MQRPSVHVAARGRAERVEPNSVRVVTQVDQKQAITNGLRSLGPGEAQQYAVDQIAAQIYDAHRSPAGQIGLDQPEQEVRLTGPRCSKNVEVTSAAFWR